MPGPYSLTAVCESWFFSPAHVKDIDIDAGINVGIGMGDGVQVEVGAD